MAAAGFEQQTLLRRQVQQLQSDRRELQTTLTDPERLIASVTRFFSADGICPGGAVISRCEANAPHCLQH